MEAGIRGMIAEVSSGLHILERERACAHVHTHTRKKRDWGQQDSEEAEYITGRQRREASRQVRAAGREGSGGV